MLRHYGKPIELGCLDEILFMKYREHDGNRISVANALSIRGKKNHFQDKKRGSTESKTQEAHMHK